MSDRPTARDRRLLTIYGITVAEYDEILKFQRGVCYVCERPPKVVRLSVDHDHRVGGFTRGVLCFSCNKALAYLRDDIDRALRLLRYLTTPPARVALARDSISRPGRSTRKWRTKRERAERRAWVEARVAELWPDARKASR